MIDWETRRKEWDTRVAACGTRAVFNYCHPESELPAVTKMQEDAILPHLKAQLRGGESYVLDFGCGYGRWTPTIANLVSQGAIGVDPTPFLLQKAQELNGAANVGYLPYENGLIPLRARSMDVVWSCMVLSTVLDDPMLDHTVMELNRVLKPGGLMFLIDNTSGDGWPVVRSRWSMSRTIEEYQAAFAGFTDLTVLGHYFDLGERNSILAGRKR